MNRTAYIGGASIMTVILVLSVVIIWSVFNPAEREALSSIPYTAEANATIEAPGANEQTNMEEVTKPEADKIPGIIDYTVKSGDNLSSIANAYNVSINTIALSNGIAADAMLKEGQALSFPSVDGLLYEIKSGETLWDISNTYDIDVSDITKDNGLTSPDKLKIGQKIILAGAKDYKEIKTDSNTNVTKSSTPAAKPAAKPAKTVRIASRGTTYANTSASGLWPVRGAITSPFGMRWGKLHKGIDIGAATGTDVHAYMGGVVVFSGWDDGGYGNLVIIDHGNGLYTYYGHNSKLLVSNGQNVSQGQHIADVGSTGDATGPHLHFEVRVNGTPVNPMAYLK